MKWRQLWKDGRLLVHNPATPAVTRWLKSQLFEVSPFDPSAYSAALVALLLVAGLAAFLPARRATRGDLSIALHHE